MSPVLVRDERSTHADARLVPAGVPCGLPKDLAAAASDLGVTPSQFQHMRGGALQAELDLPSGFWRVWPELGLAAPTRDALKFVHRARYLVTPIARWTRRTVVGMDSATIDEQLIAARSECALKRRQIRPKDAAVALGGDRASRLRLDRWVAQAARAAPDRTRNAPTGARSPGPLVRGNSPTVKD